MESGDVVGLIAVISLFMVLPWIIFHYITKWKTTPTLTRDDEAMLEELYQLARKLSDRVETVERLVAHDHPDFQPGISSRRMHEEALLDEVTPTARPLRQTYRN